VNPDTVSNSLLREKREIKELEDKKINLVSTLELVEEEYLKNKFRNS
jgi:hypothetical protein